MTKAKEAEVDPRAPVAVESDWGTVYRCPLCDFATTDQALVVEHLDPRYGMHRIPFAPPDRPQPPASEPLTADERTELNAFRAERAATTPPETTDTTAKGGAKE